MKTLKSKVISGIFWQYSQRIGGQVVQFLVSIILARLLLPEDFGVIALISVFITVANIFIDSGFGNALIQKQDIDEIDRSSVFYLNLTISLILYGLLFVLAPYVAIFYEIPFLSSVLRVEALLLIFMAFSCVQNAIMVRQMLFKKNFIINSIAIVVSAVVGISMAYTGYGIWSLVFSQLSMQFVSTLGYWFLVGWRPHRVFSWKRVSTLFRYSSKILAGSLLHVIYNNIYNIIIGKRYSTEHLGYYNRGMIIPTLLVENAANTLNSVMFPALASIQKDRMRVRMLIRKMERVIAYVVFLLIALLIPLSEALIRFLLTDKWLPAVPFLRIVSCTVCFSPFVLINMSILTSLGYGNLYLKATTISKLMAIGLVLLGSFFNIYIMVTAGAIGAALSVVITSYWNKSLIQYSFADFIKDIGPAALLAMVTGCLLYLFTMLGYNYLLTIFLGGTGAVIFYVSVSYLLRFKQTVLMTEIIKNI